VYQIPGRSMRLVNEVNSAQLQCTVFDLYISDSKGSLIFMHLLCNMVQGLPYSESK